MLYAFEKRFYLSNAPLEKRKNVERKATRFCNECHLQEEANTVLSEYLVKLTQRNKRC